MPWITGYKPRSNYQDAIFNAIERYLTQHPDVLQPAPLPHASPSKLPEIFVSPPCLILFAPLAFKRGFQYAR